MTDEQMPLFAPPDAPPRPTPTLAKGPAGGRARYTRYDPAHRVLCDDCVLLVHQLGVANAPWPASARWTRRAGNEVHRLCHEHKSAREADERR